MHTALRRVWHAWETDDPERVEATIAAVAADTKLPPALRAYAGMIEAYARRRRGDLEGAERRIAALGFVRDWVVVGPFENQNRTGLAERYLPEAELSAPIAFDRFYQGKVRPVAWRAAPDRHRLGWIDLGSMVRPAKDVCVYASTFVTSPRAREATLFVGATGAFRLFFDAEAVLSDEHYRTLDADRHAAVVALQAGQTHRITAKVCAGEAAPTFALRLGDDRGAPMRDVRVEASEEASARASQHRRVSRRSVGTDVDRGPMPLPSQRRPRAAVRVAGALQAFERELARRPKDPGLLEDFARYLLVTGGEAEDDHEARDRAEQAARLAPTVPRLLLAAELAEDRNGRRRWIEDAARLAATKAERLAVLRAQAQLARSGPGSLDAQPLYRAILELDSDDPVGRLGVVDRLVEAGLPRTALAEIERALDARPRSVALLRAAALQLRALGRDVEADTVEAQLRSLRFDDAGAIQRQIERATARREPAVARDWQRRLLQLEPTNPWAYDVVARSQRALGDVQGAVATYRRWLDNAPEDTGTLRALADLEGERGDSRAQVELLRTLVRVSPQDTAARDYLERLQPSRMREDERLAWDRDRIVAAASHPPPTDVTNRVLRRLSVTTFFDSGLASHFHQRVFQPLTEEAAKRSRTVAFAYHSDRQMVELRGVRVHRKDGRVDETFTVGESPLDDPAIQMYTLERVVQVTLPELRAGDIVDVRYRIDDVAPQSELADYVAEIEPLAERDPVANAEYVVVAPSRRKLFTHATGLPGLRESVAVEGDRTIRRFEASNLAGRLPVAGAPPSAESHGYVHVSSLEDWAAVGRWYWGLAKDKLEPDDEIRRLAAEVTRGTSDLEGRVAAVYRYAASEIRYVALEFGIEGIRPRRASLTLARGWGDCKDKAALTVAMLRALGIDAELVLVRTGLRGRFDPAVASLAPFDHAIAFVPALGRYLDGTAEATGSDELPAMDRGALALRITEGQGRLTTLPERVGVAAEERREIALTLDTGGGLRFQATLSQQGFEASAWRRRYQADTTRRERITADLTPLLGPLSLDPEGIDVSDAEALEQPVVLRVRGRATAASDGVAWSVPLGQRTSLMASFAAWPDRVEPLLLGPPRTTTERWTLAVPPNARVLGLPAEVAVDGPLGRFVVRVIASGPSVELTRTLEFRRSRIEPAEYGAWRDFCRAVDAAGTPRVLVAR